MGDDEDRAALETLCRDYWRPLYVLARRFGHAPYDAEDLVQGFFAKLLARDWLHSAGPERGKFRTFLSVAFRRHMADEHDFSTRQKRGGGVATVPLDAEDAENFLAGELATVESAEHAFDKAWALGIIATAQARLREECAAAGKAALRSMTRSLARELLPRKIRVNAISPGPIETGILDRALPKEAAEQTKAEMTASNPMLRLGDPEEIAKAVEFLAFDATYTTGVELAVDGGATQL